MSFDPGQFKKLERTGYNRLGPRYLQAAGPRQSLNDALVAGASLAPGQVVLDLAAGPGLVALACRKAIGPQGLAVASDIAEAQLACCPEALARVAADGEHLPFSDAAFHRVLCGLGLMMFPDEDRALAEMRRVLRPGGRVALTVWGPAEEVPLVECALACMRRLLPAPKVPRPSIFRYGGAGVLEGLLQQGGFSAVAVRPLRLSSTFLNAEAYWQAFLAMAGGAAESISRLPPEKAAALAAAVADELSPHAVSGGYRLTSTVLLASGEIR